LSFLPPKINTVVQYVFPYLPPKEVFSLLAISTVSILCYSLGSYLTIASFTFLHPEWIIELIGFFALAFLLGYLSFLTPAGFGVREGTVIFGLAKLIPFNVAGFVSLFTRIILMISELIFILIALVLYKIQNPLV